jgi:hypothetical protein
MKSVRAARVRMPPSGAALRPANDSRVHSIDLLAPADGESSKCAGQSSDTDTSPPGDELSWLEAKRPSAVINRGRHARSARCD